MSTTTPFHPRTFPAPPLPLPLPYFTLYLDIETTRFFEDPELASLPR